MTIYLASDHGGFAAKQALAAWLEDRGHDVLDLGPKELDPNDDYPDYAQSLAARVGADEESRGILLCRNGQGVAIAANRTPGIRAVTPMTEEIAASTRQDDDANVLCLAADYLDEPSLQGICLRFIDTPFSNEERHRRRIEKLDRSNG